MIEPRDATTMHDPDPRFSPDGEARLHVVSGETLRDLEPGNPAAERAVRDLLVALGQDPDRPGLRDTPRRVAAAFEELLTPVPFTPTTFPNEEGYDELVLARDIEFSSLCEHHL